MSDFIVVCHYCGRADSNLKRCSRCKSVHYCTKVCQTMDWTDHKTKCVNSQSSDLGKKKEFRKKIKQKKGRKTRPEQTDNKKEIGEDEQLVNCFDPKTILEAVPTTNTEEEKTPVREETSSEYVPLYERKSKDNGESLRSDSPENTAHEEKNDGQREANGKADDSDSENGPNTEEKETKESYGTKDEEIADNANESEGNPCVFCASPGCLQKCSRCKETFYCSKECQRQDWKRHKRHCIKKLSEEDERILRTLKKKQDQVEKLQKIQEDNRHFGFFDFGVPSQLFCQTLTPEQALRRATRPEGSLAKAVRMARFIFPVYGIITTFKEVPLEQRFPFFPFMMSQKRMYVLVAFMYRYHEHVMRHGVYLKDAMDRESKVEFYLDFDNPFPFFSYSQVKPGGYICLVEPVMHFFMDGTVGIRIDNPEDVRVLDIEKVMKEWA